MAVAVLAPTAFAATKTWDGSSSGNWATDANWSGGTAPVAGDDLVFPANITRTNMNNNFSPNRAWNSVAFTGSNYVLNGNTLIVTNGIRMDTPFSPDIIPDVAFNNILANVELRASQCFTIDFFGLGGGAANTGLRIMGDVALGSHTLTNDGLARLEISGVVSGTGGIEKTGHGELHLGRSSTAGGGNNQPVNTFSGPVNVWHGRLTADNFLEDSRPLGSTNGVTTIYPSALFLAAGTFTNETLVLAGGEWWGESSYVVWHGPVNVTDDSRIGRPSVTVRTLIIDGVISGSGGLTIHTDHEDDSILTPAGCFLRGTANNTITGTLRLAEGVLILDKSSGFQAIASAPLIVGESAVTPPTNAIVRHAANNQIGIVEMTILNDGMLDLDGHSDSIGGFALIGGTVTNHGSGLLTLNRNITAAYEGQAARIYGDISLGNFIRTFTVTNSPSTTAPELNVYGSISAGGIVKAGDGYMGLLSSNSYAGLTTVSAGSLLVQDDFGLGSTANGTIVNSGATLYVASSAVPEPLTLNGDGDTIESRTGALRGLLATCSGPITLAMDCTINVPSSSPFNLTLSGPVSGSGNLSKTGPGTLIFSGSNDNVYSGDTWVKAGVLQLSKSGAFAISNSASLIIGDSSDGISTDIVRYGAGGSQIHVNVDLFINRTGLLDLNGFVDDVGDITLTGGTIQTGTGTLQLRGDLLASAFALGTAFDSSHITGNLDLGTSTRTFTVNHTTALVGPGVELIVDAAVRGTGGILKTGAGDMELGASNTFSGAVTVSDGRLLVSNDNALGATSSGTTINGDAVLEILGGICVPAEPLTLNRSGANPGAVLSSSGTNFWDGPVTLSQTAVINAVADSRLDLGGIISGPGGLTKIGPGTLGFEAKPVVLNRDNIFAGTTLALEGLLLIGRTHFIVEVGSFYDLVVPGTLIVGDDAAAPGTVTARVTGQEAIHTLSQVTVNSSGLFDLTIYTVSIGSLEGEGPVSLGPGAASAQFIVGNNHLSRTYSGIMSGSRSNVTKRGTGTLTLAGNSTYTAPTLVEAGILQVDGLQSSSDVTVRSGATLSGRGRVGDLTSLTGATNAPGTSPGRLTTLNTVISNDATLRIELNGPVAGADYDQLKVNGSLDLTGSKLAASLGFAPFEGEVFIIIDNNSTDAVIGTFDGLANGAILNLPFGAGSIPMRILYNSGSGNDVTLTVTNLPLSGGVPIVGSGNGNSRVDPNECSTLFLVVTNRAGTTLSGITGTIETTTPGVVITERTSAYNNIAFPGAGTNLVPFQFFTTPNFLCGQSIEFLLTLTAAGQPRFSIRYVVESGQLGAPQTFNNNTSIPLPGSGTVNSPMVVSGVNGGIADVTVSLVLNHPNLGELFVSLVPPGGTPIPLAASLSGIQLGNNCNGGRTVFDDDASLLITDGSSPYVGTFRPITPLANLDGRSGALVNGTWNLQIQDLVPNAAAGALSCWSLTITPATCANGSGPCEICNGPFFGALTAADPPRSVTMIGGAPTTCAAPTPCPGTLFFTSKPTDTYTVTNAGPTACVTVSIDAPCSTATNPLYSVALRTAPPAPNYCASFLGHSGTFSNAVSYSFMVPANAVFEVLVHGAVASPCDDYTLRVEGFECPVWLGIERLGTDRIRLNWPTYASDYRLECATNIPFTNPIAVPTGSFVVDGKFVHTNGIAAPRQFYRLRKP